MEGGWCSKEVRVGYGVGLWKTIRKLWDLVSCKLSFLAGNWKRIKFWNDKWCGETPFEGCVPESLCYHFFQGCLGGRCLGWG